MNLTDHPDYWHWARTLDENPGSAEHALRFADWMDEEGFPAHAEMVRLHHSTPMGMIQEPGGRRSARGYTGKGQHSLELWKNPDTEFGHSSELWLRTPHVHGWTTFSAIIPKQQGSLLHDALVSEGAAPSRRRSGT